MNEHEVAWPTGMSDQDPAARERPLVFNPQGFLVAILEDADQAEQAKTTLTEAGFADRDLRVYTSQQILADHQRYLAQRSLARRVVGGLTDDTTALERYLDRAREGRAALWVHVPADADAKRQRAAVQSEGGVCGEAHRRTCRGRHPLSRRVGQQRTHRRRGCPVR